jgi:KaiC/GvpD/RAD55 family RecA-like ATPase
LVWDLDSKDNISVAQDDAKTLLKRLDMHGIKESSIQVYFSGNKGFTIQVDLEDNITPAELKTACIDFFGKDLKTLDRSIYNASRILRIPFTRHENGLYKIPLTQHVLKSKTSIEIQELAKSLDNVSEFEYTTEFVSDVWLASIPKPVEHNKPEVSAFGDIPERPNNWKACKWNLLQGNFQDGERHSALTVLAATSRGLGYDQDTAYYLCKAAIKKQAERSGKPEFSKEELYNNIIKTSIFNSTWNGGTYSCKTDPWLKNYCEQLGAHGCQGKGGEDEGCVEFSKMTEVFSSYAKNFDQNVIKTGIVALDQNLTLVCSTLNGLLGQPGAGKTSAAVQILRDASLIGVPSMFFSMDMGLPIVYGKLLQRETGKSLKEVMQLVKSGDKKIIDLMAKVDKEYQNVSFAFQSAVSVADMKRLIKERQEITGQPIKLVVIDYLECIAGPYAEATANTGFIANQLKDLANDMNVCVLLLLQTQKHSTPDISDPLLTMKGVKGSSIIEQSCSTITTLWREGYSPENVQHDKYMSFAVVKNRFGSLWKGDFFWNGPKGIITPLTDAQEYELKKFKEEKKEKKAEQNNTGGFY